MPQAFNVPGYRIVLQICDKRGYKLAYYPTPPVLFGNPISSIARY
jgi:hypothetical protein